jgi:hypothetical protein
MMTSVANGGDGTQNLCPKNVKIVETYWHDHSFERSWGVLSNGTISFLIQPMSGEYIFGIFLKKTSGLKGF